MPRWTTTQQDHARIAKVNQQMPIGGIVKITLSDRKVVEGVLRRCNAGNNAGQGGWQYYGECEIETIGGQRWIIDYLDIDSAESAWSKEKGEEYEKAGLISIVKQI